MPGEFELIYQHFIRPTTHTDLSVGDDGALFSPRAGQQLVVSTDMLAAGTHFFPDTEAADLGWKTAAVNISDMAAMGAEPRWIVLALALPSPDDMWVAKFASGFYACCEAFGVDWIGGDTTHGPLNLCATVFGEVPQGSAITRCAGEAGDELWVSGAPGCAALGLRQLQGQAQLDDEGRERCLSALHRPQPRVALGIGLRGIASAMLDVSDGLLGDLGHILAKSGVGARLYEAQLPFAALRSACADEALLRECLLSGGDDYELLFAAPAAHRAQIDALGVALNLPLHCIGTLNADVGTIQLQRIDGTQQALAARGYQHFRNPDHG